MNGRVMLGRAGAAAAAMAMAGGGPVFRRLNTSWDAEPNAPEPRIERRGNDVVLTVVPNRFIHDVPENCAAWRLRFAGATHYRMVPVNDEGWWGGQCRFSELAPEYGAFYEIGGDTLDALEPEPWAETGNGEGDGAGLRHFLWYLRDETFECKARDWRLEPVVVQADMGER